MSEETQETNTLKLILDKDNEEGQFNAVNTSPKWAFMKFAVAVKKKDDMATTEALINLSYALVRPEERNRFDDWMNEHDDVEGLVQAVNDLALRLENRPLAPSSSSAPSLTPTEPTSQVVSFGQGTAADIPAVVE